MFTHCVVSLLSAEADTAEVGAKLTAGSSLGSAMDSLMAPMDTLLSPSKTGIKVLVTDMLK
jgi:hypothetical protein